jgi:hypothetical protein
LKQKRQTPGFRISAKKDKDAEPSDHSNFTERRPSGCPILVKNGKIEIPVNFFLPPAEPPERIDRFLDPEFVAPLAAMLWRGDDKASVTDARALIEACAKELAWRKSPFSEITLSGKPPPDSFRQTVRLWKDFPLEVVIFTAATIGRLQKPENAANQAFLIIEAAMLEKKSDGNAGEQQQESANLPSNQASSYHLSWDLAKRLQSNLGWKEAPKRITAAKRPDLATNRLRTFLNDRLKSKAPPAELKHAMADREKNGFTLPEVHELRRSYADWQPRYRKSRQSESGKKIGRKNLHKKSG